MWFSNTLRGDVAKRRSHIWMTGSLSSSEASTSWVATSGCQSIPEQCICNSIASEMLMIIASPALKSTCALVLQQNWDWSAPFIQVTNPVAVVADLNNWLVLSQVPHNRFPAWVDRGQDVLDLPVPGDGADVFSRLIKRKIVISTGLAMRVNTSHICDYRCWTHASKRPISENRWLQKSFLKRKHMSEKQ